MAEPLRPAPHSEGELVQRAEALAGLPLGDIAAELGAVVPPDLKRAKGWTGQLLERVLGARSASRAQPDFDHLGIELKSLPIDARGRPCESTFVCTIDLAKIADVEWGQSLVKKKLSRVLWIPVEGERSLPVERRRIGMPILWSPTLGDEARLRFDWDELAGVIGRGDVESLSGHFGRCLQVRPKAANSRSRRVARDEDGARFATLPRGFYLRATFTAGIIEQALTAGNAR